MTPNPPWVNRLLADNWPAIVRRVPETWLPMEKPTSTPKRRSMEELGCGHYGCVMPTVDPNIVCKVTSDPLEAHLIAIALKLGEPTEGMVRYESIYQLAGEHRGRPTFIVWRETAYDVGDLTRRAVRRYGDNAEWTFMRRLALFRQVAGWAKATLQRGPHLREEAAKLEDWAWRTVVVSDRDLNVEFFWEPGMAEGRYEGITIARYRGAERVAASIRACEIIAEFMANEPEGYLVGQALAYYLDEKVLLADVHAGNIGHAIRPENYREPIWVITDPGHAVPLDKKWDEVKVQAI